MQIPASVTFMKNRRKFTTTRSSGTIIAVRDNIVQCVRIVNTDCKLCFSLKSVYRLVIWPTLSLTLRLKINMTSNWQPTIHRPNVLKRYWTHFDINVDMSTI